MRINSSAQNTRIANALAQTSFEAKARITTYNSRAYFDADSPEYDDAYFPTLVTNPTYDLVGDTHNSRPESVYYNASKDKALTVVVDDAKIKILIEGDIVPVVPTYSAATLPSDPLTRPCIYGNKILYYNSSSSNWKIVTYDVDLVIAHTAACITASATFSTLGKGAGHLVSTTEGVIFWIDDGGIRATFIDSAGTAHESNGRFLNPLAPYTTGGDGSDNYITHKSAAVLLNSNLFVYLTTYDGSVKVMKYTFSTNAKDGVWSEIRIAVPEDLSTFELCNAIVANNRVFLSGKFSRSDQFVTPSIYTLVPWSDDGFTFALDRLTLCTLVDLHFNIQASTTELIFCSINRIARLSAPYQVIGENADSTTIECISVSGSGNSGFSLNLKAGNEAYYTDSNVSEGYYAKLEIGVRTTNGMEWLKYHECVIQQTQKSWADGKRSMAVGILAAGLWKTAVMTHPFYMEFQSMQQYCDNMKDLANLAKLGSDAGVRWALSQDFFAADVPDGWTWLSHVGSSTNDHWCPDLLTLCNDYPVLGDASNYTVRLYGWSRAGVIGSAPTPDPADPTPTSTLNDTFYALLTVENTDGVQSTIVSTVGELLSTHDHPPQTWFPDAARAGSYPVEFSIANPGQGWKIIKLGIRVTADTGTTTYYLERVDMPEITAEYTILSSSVGFAVEDVPAPGASFSISRNDIDAVTGSTNHLVIDEDLVVSQTNEKTIIITTPDDGVSHTYNLRARLTLVTHGNYLAGAWAPQEIYVHGGTNASSYNNLYTQKIVGDNYPYVPGNYGEGSYQEYNNSVVLTPNTTYRFIWIFSIPWPVNVTGNYQLDFETMGETTPPGDDPAIDTTPKQISTIQKGVDQVMFSSNPYSAWNFDQETRIKYHGPYTYAGCIGLASDEHNYIMGYLREGYLGIAKFRGGTRTVLYEVAEAGIVEDAEIDLRFWHRDGLFGVEYKLASSATWATRGTQLVYEWAEADGEMATTDDLYHVGIYSVIDPPKFRTAGFRSTGTVIPVMPCDLDPNSVDEYGTLYSDFLEEFAAAGQISCDDIKYTYTGKVDFFTNPKDIQGPFQLRNILEWNSHNVDLDDAYQYTGINAVEFTKFDWLDSDPHHDDFNGCAIGVSSGYAWLNDETFFKPWITTDGVIVFQRHRGRFYALNDSIPANNENVSLQDKCYLTNGLTGIACTAVLAEEYQHLNGTFVFIDSDDKVEILGYRSCSGNSDNSIETLLDVTCKIAGTKATFPGDEVTASHIFTDGGSLAL